MVDRSIDVTYNPIYPPKKAAEYLGISTRTLRDLNLERHPMPGTGRTRHGYRLSTLNAYLARLNDLTTRIPRLRTRRAADTFVRDHGRFARAAS